MKKFFSLAAIALLLTLSSLTSFATTTTQPSTDEHKDTLQERRKFKVITVIDKETGDTITIVVFE